MAVGKSSSALVGIAASAFAGMLFGIGMEKGKLVIPEVITSQMSMQRMTMMSGFLAASFASFVSFAALYALGLAGRQVRPKQALGLGWLRSYGGNVLGGALVGMGMTLSGSCPGSAFAQLGAGFDVRFVFAGGMVGAVLQAPLSRWVKRHLPRHAEPGEKTSLDAHLNVSYPLLALLFAAALAAVLVLVNTLLAQWQLDLLPWLPQPVRAGLPWWDLRQPAWPPYVAGALMGAMQIPTLLAAGCVLGASTSYVTVAQALLERVGKLTGTPALGKLLGAQPNWPQVAFVAAVAAGAFLSRTASGVTYAVPPAAAPPALAFVGGMLMLFGSRLGGGCTSGHGISGMAQLSVSSLLATASMFAGGMGLKAILG